MNDGQGKGAAERRLATYGTLAPGRANAQQLAALAGHWRRGTVKGRLVDAFEGAGYRRVIAPVRTPEGTLDASIYVIER